MIPYSFYPEPEAELSAVAEFYESRIAGLGRLFSAEVQRTVWFVRAYPDVGAAVQLRIRRALVDRFPYAIMYRRDRESIHVLAVAHLHRRPVLLAPPKNGALTWRSARTPAGGHRRGGDECLGVPDHGAPVTSTFSPQKSRL